VSTSWPGSFTSVLLRCLLLVHLIPVLGFTYTSMIDGPQWYDVLVHGTHGCTALGKKILCAYWWS
jgi:hypothetical protein